MALDPYDRDMPNAVSDTDCDYGLINVSFGTNKRGSIQSHKNPLEFVAGMIDSQFANTFADHWIRAWNAHDLDDILSHYTDDFEMSSPVIAGAMNEPSGKLKGKGIIRVYWSKALASILTFTLKSCTFWLGRTVSPSFTTVFAACPPRSFISIIRARSMRRMPTMTCNNALRTR